MAVQEIPFSDITFDVTNDSTEKLLTAARKSCELRRALDKTDAVLAKALAERAKYIDNVLATL